MRPSYRRIATLERELGFAPERDAWVPYAEDDDSWLMHPGTSHLVDFRPGAIGYVDSMNRIIAALS